MKVDADVSVAIKNWLEWLAVSGSAENTVSAYHSDVLGLIDFLYNFHSENIDIQKLSMLSQFNIRSWLAKRKGEKISSRSNARALSAVKSFFIYFKKHLGILNEEILNASVKVKQKKLPKSISFQEIEEVIKSIDAHSVVEWIASRNKSLFYLLYGSGIRISEALSLKVSDIENSTIKILGKGQKERLVYLLKPVLESLQKYIKLCPFLHASDNYLFINRSGGRLDRTTVASYLIALRRKFNLPESLTPHVFRHSFATHLLQNDLGIREIQELLGHSSLASTEIYTKMNAKSLIEKYKKFQLR